MAQVAPVGAKTFYVNGLQGLKDALEAVNGVTSGLLTAITAMPADIDSGSWAEVGAGGVDGNVGSNVIAYAPLAAISNVIAGDAEGPGETGWKLTFTGVDNIPILTTDIAIAFALIVGRDTFAGGSDADVRYIVDMTDTTLTALTNVDLPTFDVEIKYAVNKP